MERPVIGDFRGPPSNTPRAAPQKTEEKPLAAAPEAPPATASGDEAAPPSLDELQMTPAERYRERLKSVGVTNEEAQLIFDSVLERGYYEEAYFLDKKQTRRVVFRTRAFSDEQRLRDEMELRKPALNASVDSIVALYNISAALYEWDGKPVDHTEAREGENVAFDKVKAMVRKLPMPIFTRLQELLHNFDQKTMAVFSEGSAENF